MIQLSEEQILSKTSVYHVTYLGEYKTNSVYHAGLYVQYKMVTTYESTVNEYIVICKIEGLEHDGSPYLSFRLFDSKNKANEYTLENASSIEELFECNKDLIGK